MRVKSDFREAKVDPWFHGHWRIDQPVYERMSITKRTRIMDHDLLEDVGFKVPERGLVKDFKGDRYSVCVYFDLFAHSGQYKSKVDIGWARAISPDCYATRWIGQSGMSYRVLAIGSRIFWFRYESDNAFSNRWNVLITEAKPTWRWSRNAELDIFILQKHLKEPMIAVDFVLDGGEGYAIDLNTAPGLAGTPVFNYLTGQEIHDLIENRWREVQTL